MTSEDTSAGGTGDPTPERSAEGNEITRLMGELARLARQAPEQLARRVARLTVREQAELALRLPASQRVELMLHSPKPMRLIRTLPDTDLYLTVREVGPADAGPLLALASPEQLLHLIDLEGWRGDRFDADRAGGWVAMMLEAGEPALKRFLRHADDELLILLFQRWIRVEQIEYEDSAEKHGHGEGEAGTEAGTMTPDGYYRFTPSIPDHAAAIRRLLQVFYTTDPERYRATLWRSLWSMPSEAEEEALRWRQSRLEEHGFPDPEEALSVYAPPAGTRLRSRMPEQDPDGLGASRSFLMVLPPNSRLAAAVESMPREARDRVLFEMLSLANRILVADGADTGDPAVHRAVIEKAASYLRIALDSRGLEQTEHVRATLDEVPVIELFREGWARAVELQARARKLVRDGWVAGRPDALKLLDHPMRERIDGLLETRPRHAEIDPEGLDVRLREFRSTAELQEAAVAVEMADTLGGLFVGRLGLDLDRVLAGPEPGDEPPRFSALLTTLLAWHATRGELRGDPLPPDVVADFLRTIASRRTAPPEAPARALDSLLEQMTRTYRLDQRELSLLQGFGRYCLEQLAAECGSLDPGIPIDPRAVGCLLVTEDRPANGIGERRSNDG